MATGEEKGEDDDGDAESGLEDESVLCNSRMKEEESAPRILNVSGRVETAGPSVSMPKAVLAVLAYCTVESSSGRCFP